MSDLQTPAAADDAFAQLVGQAREWIAGDADPRTVAELEALINSGDAERLGDHVGAQLTFGTAGLRAVVGPGPNRINRAVVIRATRGLADHLLAAVPDARSRGVVVGFDARSDSEAFARDVVGVFGAAGIRTRWFTTPQPTPLVAYTQKALGAAAAVVITASHNPAEYNGYKVYAEGAAQIVPPTDAAIAAAIDMVGPAREIPRDDPASSSRIRAVGGALVERYLADIAAGVPSSPGPGVTVAYTPLHGVGGSLVRRAMADAGHTDFHTVRAQNEPNATFPTVAFPNPEEPGAMDAVLALGVEVDADLVVANDPDADRLAVAVPDGHAGFRVLTGNQIGVLLADHLLAFAEVSNPLVVSSIVSTPMVHAVADAYSARSEVTLTGFKWICAAARELEQAGASFVYGFEEALGSCVGGIVHDKDGIGAAVAFADLTRQLRGTGLSVLDRLTQLYRQHGVWVSHQRSVTRPGARGASEIAAAMAQLTDSRPHDLAGHPVTQVTDFRVGAEHRPPWLATHDLVVFDFVDGRAMIRPSGTEPKCKIYVDLRAELDQHEEAAGVEASLDHEAARIAEELARFVGLR